MATSALPRCKDFEETAKVISKVGFKMFLGISVKVKDWNKEKTEFTLLLEDNPLTPFVELPEEAKNLKYSNILCGVIRGALEMVQLKVECDFVKDKLRGDDINAIKVTLKEILQDEVPVGED